MIHSQNLKKLNQVQTLKTLQESNTVYQPVVIVTGGSLGVSFQVHTRVLKWDSLKYKAGTRSVCRSNDTTNGTDAIFI